MPSTTSWTRSIACERSRVCWNRRMMTQTHTHARRSTTTTTTTTTTTGDRARAHSVRRSSSDARAKPLSDDDDDDDVDARASAPWASALDSSSTKASSRRPSPKREMSIQEYIEKHDLSKKVEEALNAAVKARPSEPMAFMVRARARNDDDDDRVIASIARSGRSWTRDERERRSRVRTWEKRSMVLFCASCGFSFGERARERARARAGGRWNKRFLPQGSTSVGTHRTRRAHRTRVRGRSRDARSDDFFVCATFFSFVSL